MTNPNELLPCQASDAMIEAGIAAWTNDPEEGWADDSDMVAAIYTAMSTASTIPTDELTAEEEELARREIRAACGPSSASEFTIPTDGEWTPHLDYAGEPMQPGQFRDPPTIPSAGGELGDMRETVAGKLRARANIYRTSGHINYTDEDAAVDELAVAALFQTISGNGMREALIRTATALNAFIECVGSPMKSRTHYRWSRFPTFDEVQEAMEANNAVAALVDQGERG